LKDLNLSQKRETYLLQSLLGHSSLRKNLCRRANAERNNEVMGLSQYGIFSDNRDMFPVVMVHFGGCNFWLPAKTRMGIGVAGVGHIYSWYRHDRGIPKN
jgi:hypothetical protein